MSLANETGSIHSEGTVIYPPPSRVRAAVADKREIDKDVCPKCDWDGSWGTTSWCPQCGYYPGVTDGICEVVCEPKDDETTPAPKHILPMWVKILLGGLAAVGVISLLAKYYFYYYGGNIGLWTICQFLVGVMMVFGAQFLTTVVAIKSGNQDSILDGLTNPLEVWRPTLETLPKGYRRLCSLAWGLTAAILAIAFIGGIDYRGLWGEPVKSAPPKTNLVQQFVAQAKDAAEAEQDGQDADIEQAINDFVGDVQSVKELPLPPADRPLACVVYGYMKDGRRDFGRVLLAARVRGQWQHVAVIPADDLSSGVRQDLSRQFRSLSQEEPLVSGPFSGTWVKPDVNLEVSFDGWDNGRNIIRPVFERLIRRGTDAPSEDTTVPSTSPAETPAAAG